MQQYIRYFFSKSVYCGEGACLALEETAVSFPSNPNHLSPHPASQPRY